MEQLWEHTYSSMLVDLNQNSGLPETERAERGYQIAFGYWDKVKTMWKEKIYYTDEEEMNYFREVKPQFTCYIEYFLILVQGLLFIPNNTTEAIKYWTDEAKRMARFCERHEKFIWYLKSNYHYQDRDYFLQRNNRHALLPQERIYADEDCRSSHDWIVRSYKANMMYQEYVSEKLEVLQHG